MTARAGPVDGERLSTRGFMWRMMRYRPWLYLANGFFWTLIHLSPLVPGLIAKAFFDRLGGDASAGGGADVW